MYRLFLPLEHQSQNSRIFVCLFPVMSPGPRCTPGMLGTRHKAQLNHGPKQAEAQVQAQSQAFWFFQSPASPGSPRSVPLNATAHTFASVPTTRSLSSTILSLMEER